MERRRVMKCSLGKRLLGLLAAGVILAAVLPARAATSVKVAYSSIAGVTAVPWIAVEKGFFRKYGLDVELVYIAGQSQVTQSLLGGTTPVVLQGIESVIRANSQGADLVMVAGIVNTVPFSIVVRPEIHKPADLKGRAMGVTRYGSSTDFVLRFALDKWGLKPNEDVPILQMGGVPPILAGMQAGKIYGGPLSLPTLAKARQAGFRELVDLSQVIPDYQTTGVVTRRSYVRDHENVIRGILKGITEAIAVFKNDPVYTEKIMREKLRFQDPLILQETWKGYSRYISKVIYPTRAGIDLVKKKLEAKNPEVRQLSFEDLVDVRYVREMEKSGFIDSLYRSR